jgi:predicted ATPase
VVVLATSREGLALEGEQLLAVPSLRPPGDDTDPDEIARSDAVRLFVERAQAADADFTLDAGNVRVVARVCRRLDGVPLAIELAAARIPTMSLSELAGALDRRFEVLAGGRRRAVKRHQTLRATIDWSYDLLDEPHQRLLARLSVFAGGWTRDAADAVCAGDPIDPPATFELLADLVARSLVVADRTGPDTRYRLLETIREYGEERLVEHGETMPLRDRHARYFIEQFRVMSDRVEGPDQLTWEQRIRAENENLLAAMAHALDIEDIDLAMGLLMSFRPGLQIGEELSLRADAVLALPSARQHPGYPYALGLAAMQAWSRGEHSLAEELCDAAIEAEQAQGVPSPSAVPLGLPVGMVRTAAAIMRGAMSEAAQSVKEGAELARAHGHVGFAANLLGGAAAVMTYGGEDAAAVAIATEGLEFARAARMPRAIVFNLHTLAVALADREPGRARALFDEALALYKTLGYEGIAELIGMTLAAARLADWHQTARLAIATIRRLHWMGNRPFLAGMMNVSARALVDTDPEAAALIHGAARTFATETATSSPTERVPRVTTTGTDFFRDIRHETTRRLDDTLGEERRRELQTQGAAMQYDDVVAHALAHLDTLLLISDP